MPDSIFIVSEWLPKQGCDQQLWNEFKKLMDLSRKEEGCLRAHATRQVPHPDLPSNSIYTIVLMQEYVDMQAFETHCTMDYVTNFFKNHIEDKKSTIVEDWQCRILKE